MASLVSQTNWPMALLSTGKYLFAIVCAAFLGFTVATKDLWFLIPAFIFFGFSLSWAATQMGLVQNKRWARRATIVISIFQLASVLLPLAALSLYHLIRANELPVSETPMQKTWSMHKPVATVMATVFALIMISHFIFGRDYDQNFQRARSDRSQAEQNYKRKNRRALSRTNQKNSNSNQESAE